MLEMERREPNTLVLSGELDFASYDLLSDALDNVEGPVRLEVSGLMSIDSSGLRLIVERLKIAPVMLVGASAHVMRVIELTGSAKLEGLTFERPASSSG